MKKNKYRLIPAILLCFLVTTGAVLASVSIITPNGEPLIDLDALINSTETGQEGSTDLGSETDPVETVTEEEVDMKPSELTVTVRDNRIELDGTYYFYDKAAGSLPAFEEALGEYSDIEVTLIDDYAEAHAYKYAEACITGLADRGLTLVHEPDYGSDWGVSK